MLWNWISCLYAIYASYWFSSLTQAPSSPYFVQTPLTEPPSTGQSSVVSSESPRPEYSLMFQYPGNGGQWTRAHKHLQYTCSARRCTCTKMLYVCCMKRGWNDKILSSSAMWDKMLVNHKSELWIVNETWMLSRVKMKRIIVISGKQKWGLKTIQNLKVYLY